MAPFVIDFASMTLAAASQYPLLILPHAIDLIPLEYLRTQTSNLLSYYFCTHFLSYPKQSNAYKCHL